MKQVKTTFRLRTFITFSILLVILSPNLIKATITPVGDIDPAYPGGNPDPWNVGGGLIIGNSSVGSIDVNDGSGITSAYGIIGNSSGGDGTITIIDPLSYWTNSNYLLVGYSGDANMIVSNGGQVTNTDGYIGYNPGNDGTVTITDSNSLWENSGTYLFVGYYGDANMVISDGGHVKNSYGMIGQYSSANGFADIKGPNSLWENLNDLYVGTAGDANMLVSNGGKVTNQNGYIGHDSTGDGIATVTGTDSLWENFGTLFVGSYGDANMIISDGGNVTCTSGYIGRYSGGSGNASIKGPNSLWENSGTLFVGSYGDANMIISDGGNVTSNTSYIGYHADSAGYATIKDTNSLWETTNDLYVGYLSDDADLLILNGGKVTDVNGYIGYESGSDGLVTVTGVGSLWENSGDVYVGYDGDANMVVSNGGEVTNDYGYIGYISNDSGTVTVTGTDSLWDNSGILYIGYSGDANMEVSDGGNVENTYTFVGYDPNSRGTVTVEGTNSLWENSDYFFIGYNGQADITVSDGGRITHTGIYSYIGNNATADGFVTVTGTDSLWTTAHLYVGRYGDANMVVSNGGRVQGSYGVIGHTAGSVGNATITGTDSLWQNSVYLYVGLYGDANMLISDGGQVTDSFGYIGHEYSGTGLVTVDGPNSLWTNSNDLYVGHDGDGNMVVSDGGQVTNINGYIGYETDSTGFAEITGQDSLWANTSYLYVGYDSNDADLLISDGGKVTDVNGYIGRQSGSDGLATITGPNSLWENSNYLYAGWGGNANLLISNGGKATDVNGYIGYQAGSDGLVTVTGPNSLWESTHILFVGVWGDANMLVSDGSQVTNEYSVIGNNLTGMGNATITGTNSLWQNSDTLVVGYAGDANMLISGGGHVTNTYGFIGYESTGSGNVTVTGEDSLWQNSDYLIIGYNGNGGLTISDGGKVTNGDAYIGYEPTSTSSISVTGSGSLWQSTGNLYVGGWDLSAGGTVFLDVNDSGTVQASNVYIWNLGTVSGDGYLSGDVWSFGGTIGPGNSIGTLNIDGDLTMDPNSTLEVEVDNSGNSDLLSVTGDVDIQGGTVKAISTETITGTQQYTIIQANSVTGTFDILDTALLDTIVSEPNAALGYGYDYVTLQIMAIGFSDPNILYTDNQRAVGKALQKIAGGGGNDVTTALQGLETARQVRGAYDQLCGQTRPQLAPVTTAETGRFMGTVSEGMHRTGFSYGRRGGPLFAMAGPDGNIGNTTYDIGPNGTNFALGNGTNSFSDQMWGFWGKGYGMFSDRDSENGVPGYKYTVYGTSFGFDYQVAEQSLLGVTAGFSRSDVDYALTSSKADISGTHLGIYGSTSSNDWHFDSILTYSFLEYETERFITLMGQRVRGNFDGTGINGYLEARYDWRSLDSWFVQPLASFQFSCLSLDSYIESGGTSRLMFDDQSYQSYKGSLGMKVTKELFSEDDDRSAQVQLRGRWLHEFGDENSSVDASFASNPGTVFKVTDADVSRDSIVLGTGLNSQLNQYVRFTIDYDLSLNSDETAHLISAALQYRR